MSSPEYKDKLLAVVMTAIVEAACESASPSHMDPLDPDEALRFVDRVCAQQPMLSHMVKEKLRAYAARSLDPSLIFKPA